MISVALIIERTITSLGGAERSIAELAEELSRQGISVRILAAAGLPAENTTILCTGNPRKRTSFYTFEKALRHHLSNHHYDIIHSTLPFEFADIYQPRGGSYKEAMLQNIASYSCPMLQCWKQYTHVLNFRRTAFLNAEKKLCKENHKTIIAALSDYVRQQFVRHYGLPNERIITIPNGIHVNRQVDIAYADTFRRNVVSRLSADIQQDAVLFLFAANNFRLKGLRELIPAFSETIKTFSIPAVLVIAGSDKTAPYQKLASDLKVNDRILFYGPQEDAYSAMSACDAAILPSWYDPCSRFILEALALAKPVITTRFNGACERYQTNRHGLIIDTPVHIKEMAEAIEALCAAQTRKAFSQAIRQDGLKEKISITQHVGQLRQVYDIILTKKKENA